MHSNRKFFEHTAQDTIITVILKKIEVDTSKTQGGDRIAIFQRNFLNGISGGSENYGH